MIYRLESEIEKFLNCQPELTLVENDEEYSIEGIYNYSLCYNEYVAQGKIYVKILVGKDFPNSIPRFYIFDYPEEIEHIYNDGNVCLATLGELIYFLNETPSLIAFIDRFVNAFIFTLIWFNKYKRYPFGERCHGAKGLLDYYINDWQITKEQYIKMVDIVYNNKYRGHSFCFCGSGKKLRLCHGRYILSIIKNKRYRNIFIEEAQMILLEDGKDGKRKSST